jgi:hypothetical protein
MPLNCRQFVSLIAGSRISLDFLVRLRNIHVQGGGANGLLMREECASAGIETHACGLSPCAVLLPGRLFHCEPARFTTAPAGCFQPAGRIRPFSDHVPVKIEEAR